ncbi:MAG: sensor histidine kinase [Deltaproteobacteria bacterium]|nr:sensor histidine kinase [Deltaproteobacteria bacterium]
MRSIFTKLIILFLLTALVPVGLSYVVSIVKLRSATQESVIQGNMEVAKIAATNAENYFENANRVLKALSAQFGEISLETEEKDRLLKNSYLDYKYFQNIHLFDAEGKFVATSNLEPKTEEIPFDRILPVVQKGGVYRSSIYIATDPPPVRPAIRVAWPVTKMGETTGILVSEINLIYVWHLVNQIRIGEEGIVTLINPDGNVVASSNLGLLFELAPFPQYESIREKIPSDRETSLFYDKKKKERNLLVSAPLKGDLKGNIFIEQPTREAFALAHQLTRQLILFAVLIFVLMVAVGYLGVRWEILRHIRVLTIGIQKIGEGDWTHKVVIRAKDEFKILGDALNTMTGQLTEQADKIKRQERLSLIGRIAGGLVHDLKHPIANIRNWTKLLSTKYEDPKFRENFTQVVEREFGNVDLFFANLKDLTGELPFQPVPLSVERIFDEVLERFRMEAEKNNVELQKRVDPPALEIKGDRFSLSRVLSNLVSNGIQAMIKGGKIGLSAGIRSENGKNWVQISVADNGMGIPPERLKSLFQDFATTKRKGLGLGLALSQKIVEQHGGKIAVASVVGEGTCFDIRLPIPS